MVKTQFEKGIKRFRSDNGKEYANHTFSAFTSKHGIIHEFTCVDTPQQNGVAERKNRHLLEVVRCLMFQMSVPNSYWGEAVLTAVYLINRVISRVLGNTSPIKSMLPHFPSAPILQNLKTRVFGCVAFVHVHKQYRNKLDPRAIRCIFLGYAPNKRGCKCYHPPSRKFFVSKDVTFHENVSYFTRPQSQGENVNDLESESEVLVLGPSLPRTHVHAPTSVLEESTPSAPIQEY
ncbi:myosin-16 [Trifolium repens]|nr:myosin-16 [Trifolium repens]